MLLLKRPFWMSPTFTGDGPWWSGFISFVVKNMMSRAMKDILDAKASP
jgi:hypothetical protein